MTFLIFFNVTQSCLLYNGCNAIHLSSNRMSAGITEIYRFVWPDRKFITGDDRIPEYGKQPIGRTQSRVPKAGLQWHIGWQLPCFQMPVAFGIHQGAD